MSDARTDTPRGGRGRNRQSTDDTERQQRQQDEPVVGDADQIDIDPRRPRLNPDQALVYDKNAYPVASNPTGHREHEVNGRRYKLHHQKPTVMPMRDAVMFMADDSFLVVDHEGNVLRPRKPQAESTGGQRLQPGQTIAGYDELTQDSLVKRVLPLDPGVSRRTSRAALIRKLLDADGVALDEGSAGEEEGEESGEAELEDED